MPKEKEDDKSGQKKEKKPKGYICPLISFLIIFWFLISIFEPSLMFSKTITAGGDTASHYLAADYMTNHLLPNGRLMGWLPGWYAGMPIFQSYFIPPYLLMAFLSLFVGLEAAFKLVTAMGVFMLPFCAFAMMRLMGFRKPTPSLAALFTLGFLFMENHSMWGGNIPSTLAGEFSYLISLGLTLVFFGLLYRGVRSGRHLAATTVFFAFLTMTHVYTLIWVLAATPAFMPYGKKALKRAAAYIMISYPTAFFLTAFWTVPMVYRMGYTTPYALRWHISEVLLPPIIWPFLVLAFSSAVLGILLRDSKVWVMLWAMACTSVLFFIAPYIGFVDIRFIPFAYLMVFLLSAHFLGFAASKMRGAWMLTAIVGFLMVFWVCSANALFEGGITDPRPRPEAFSERFFNWTYEGYIPHWVRWNYEGFENKPEWEQYMSVNTFLEGDHSSPRAKFEHSRSYNAAGSVRAFENIPLFSNRSIVEGLFIHAIATPPFSFYLQSEVSEQTSCPFWRNYPCTRMNLDLGAEHLKMFNAGYLVARSQTLKSLLRESPDWMLAHQAPPYEVWELKDNPNMYVTVPENLPYEFEAADWKKTSYEWFKKARYSDPRLVFTNPAPGEEGAFAGKIFDASHAVAKPTGVRCRIKEDIEAHRIAFSTDCPGAPHIISVSYYPSWRAVGGERIHLVSPSFMMVVPKSTNVEIIYSKDFMDWAGIIMSLIGIVCLPFLGRAMPRK